MKRIVLSLAIFTALSVNSFAQSSEKDVNEKAPCHLRDLNLSTEQESQIETLREQYRENRRALDSQFENEMKRILTPEQAASLESMKRDPFTPDRDRRSCDKKNRHEKKDKNRKNDKRGHRGAYRGAKLNQLDDNSKQEIARLRKDYEEKKSAIEKSRVAPDTQREQLEALCKQYRNDVLDVVNASKTNKDRPERPDSVDAWMGIAPDNE